MKGKQIKINFLLFTRELGSAEKARKRDILIPRVLRSYSHPAQAWMDSCMGLSCCGKDFSTSPQRSKMAALGLRGPMGTLQALFKMRAKFLTLIWEELVRVRKSWTERSVDCVPSSSDSWALAPWLLCYMTSLLPLSFFLKVCVSEPSLPSSFPGENRQEGLCPAFALTSGEPIRREK